MEADDGVWLAIFMTCGAGSPFERPAALAFTAGVHDARPRHKVKTFRAFAEEMGRTVPVS